MAQVAQREALDLMIPVTDAGVAALSRFRTQIGARVFLPSPETLTLCYDKLRLAERLRAKRVPTPASYGVSDLRSLKNIFARLPPNTRGWCRARMGAGSLGAAPVANARHARAWIDLWCEARGVKPNTFMVAEYLPGRDFASQSLWRHGDLVLIKTTERLAYVDGASRLSGTSSVASVHKTVYDRRLLRVAKAAVLAVDRRATGAFSVDMKENSAGVPCVTEINAGRMLSGTTIFDETGRHNMTAVYVLLGIGALARIAETYDSLDGSYVSRGLDTSPHIFDSVTFWDGWHDARCL